MWIAYILRFIQVCCLLCVSVHTYGCDWRAQIVVSNIITMPSKVLFSLVVTSLDSHASFPRYFSLPLPMVECWPQSSLLFLHTNTASIMEEENGPPSLSLWLELNQMRLSECCITWWWSLGGVFLLSNATVDSCSGFATTKWETTTKQAWGDVMLVG